MTTPDFRLVHGDVLDEIAERKARPIQSIPTPIESWNKLCGEEGGHEGLAKTWVAVIGGRPGARKSYLALNLAAHAIENGFKVGAINFEMSFEGYVTRFASVLTGINANEIGWGKDEFDPQQWRRAKAKMGEIYDATGGALVTNDTEKPIHKIGHIKSAYENFARVGVDMVIVDYVQLVSPDDGGDDSFSTQAWEVAKVLHQMSHKHNMVTLALSQITRAGREDQPRMHHLYGGTAWEAYANQVILLDHTYNEDLQSERCTRTQILVDKNRHGTNMKEVPIRWNWDTMRVEEDISYQQGLATTVEESDETFVEDKDEVDDLLAEGAP